MRTIRGRSKFLTAAASLTAVTAAVLLTAVSTLYAQDQRPMAELSELSSAYAVQFHASYNQREGYWDFGEYLGFDQHMQVENTNPWMYGGAIGKRIDSERYRRLRTQVTAEASHGRVKDTEFNGDDYGVPGTIELFSNYLTGGIITEAHILFPSAARTYFISLGPGVHITSYKPTFQTTAGEPITGLAEDGWREPFVSLSANVGVGMEYITSNNRAISVGYNFRFVQTAKYIEYGALFPMGVVYDEFFYSHIFQVQVLVPKKR
jgi:hypothetical protein